MSPDIITPNNLPQQRSSRHSSRSPAHWASPTNKPKRRPSQQHQQVLEKCYSEPFLFLPLIGDDVVDQNDTTLVGGSCRSFNYSGDGDGESGCLTRFHTYHDVSLSSASPYSPLSRFNAGYDKEAKVVITVSVEGSPGPIRTLVKLGTTVEDTINLVVRKYSQEGRTPRLDKDSFSFDLHVSYFSLQCLERSDAIGDAGSRSFYLRKNDRKWHNEVGTSAHGVQNDDVHRSMISPSSNQLSRPQMSSGFHPFFGRKMNKFERRFLRLFQVLGCLDSK